MIVMCRCALIDRSDVVKEHGQVIFGQVERLLELGAGGLVPGERRQIVFDVGLLGKDGGCVGNLRPVVNTRRSCGIRPLPFAE